MATTPTLIASTVMDYAANLLNDSAKTIYPFTVQIPYLNMALNELQEYFELNNIPVTDTVSAAITVPANVGSIGFAPDTPIPNTPYLPDNLIEPKLLWERQFNVNPYVPMARLDFLPRYDEGVEINQFIYYVWQSQEIRVLPCNQINQIKMDYTRNLFQIVTSEDDEIGVINVVSFLQYRLAALCAEFIAENKTRADDLNGAASLSLDRALGIGTKGRQAIIIRHRPFRSAYKRRTFS